MAVNSAEPERLVDYARAVVSPLREGRVAFDSCQSALLAHNRLNPGFPVDLSPVAHARSVLHETEKSLAETVIVAEAFVAADRSGGDLCTASDLSLISHTAAITARRYGGGGGSRPDGVSGYFRERDGTISFGPLEGRTHGDVLIGIDRDGEFRGPRFEDGNLVVDGRFEAFLGGRLRGDATVDVGPATVDVDGELSAGGTLELDSTASIGRDGIDVHTGLRASIAARAEAKGTVDLGPFTASGGCEAAYGAGITAENRTRITWDEVRLENALGLVWGPGGGCETSLSFSPKEIVGEVGDAGRFLWDGAGSMASTAVDAAGDLWDDAWSFGTSTLDFSAAVDWLR